MSTLITSRSQMQWLFLLGVAVLLPTVSLLWFMSQVVANERLVIRQKLAALYQDKLAEAAAETEARFASRLDALKDLRPQPNPYSLVRHLVLDGGVQGLIIWSADGTVLYPGSTQFGGGDASPDHPLAGAWQFEFQKKQYADAAALYAGLSDASDPRVATAAMLGRARSLAKLGRLDEGIEECQKVAFFDSDRADDLELRITIENARLLLLSLLRQQGFSWQNSSLLRRTTEVLRADVFNAAGTQALLPANQNLFVARQVLEILRADPAANAVHVADLDKLVAAEELSISAADTLRPFAAPFDSVFAVNLNDRRSYALRHKVQSGVVLILLDANGVRQAVSGYSTAFAGSGLACRIVDAAGDPVAGNEATDGKPFVSAALPGGFPGWTAELYLGAGDVFERAAKRQITVYLWTGALVILLFLAAAGFATQAVGRQIRLNRMKNNFIATVSHELKTPLASMRVLVDTLLEGNIRDEAQAKEYLRLAARENERLSRMIDNFLTFSRMERNKKAFVMADSDPTAIAVDAVESVQTKYAAHHCRLAVETAGDLPPIVADHDALVTVLVNLLDNACKYTGPDKQIGLKVFAERGCVCFAVSDNGVGLSRRHVRKIFDSFYQVDSSLARKSEGSGLGLSIVKFIVDAHKGKVTVESRPGKGSIFSVRLPANQANGE